MQNFLILVPTHKIRALLLQVITKISRLPGWAVLLQVITIITRIAWLGCTSAGHDRNIKIGWLGRTSAGYNNINQDWMAGPYFCRL
jgi:hypothetical protein